jgi:SAM-dependent methyltransferase
MQVLLERLTGVLDAPALYAFVDLGLPDHLDGPRPATELAALVDADADALDRLLAYLASRGCVRRDRRGRYRANDITKLLTRDSEWAGWVRFVGGPWTMAAYSRLAGSVRTGADPVVAAHGVDFFEYLSQHPDAAAAFHDAMTAGARLQALMIGGALPLAGATAILDVGGGTGSVVAHVLAANSGLRGAVLDLAEAQAGAEATFAEAGVSERASFIAGDFFASVPSGYDVHVLTAIVHDWSDKDATRILRNCAAALAPGGRICVVETKLQPGRALSFVQATDMLMLAYTAGGRERTGEQLATLWKGAGLRCEKETALASEGTLFTLVREQRHEARHDQVDA